MNNPLISVIIPIYNTGKYLSPCLDSILNQTYKNLQVILVDDGSTDGSPAVCDEYAERDNRITVIHKQNEGVSKARNTGLDIATGDYYHFPDSDDYLELDTYEYLLALIKEHSCDMINYEYYVTYSTKENKHLLDDTHYGIFDRESAHKGVMSGEPFAWNKFYTKKAVQGITFRESILRGEDSLFVHECIEQIDSMWFDKRSLYHYVQSEDSACRGNFRTSQLTFMYLYDEYKLLYSQYPDLWKLFQSRFFHTPITMYYDMYSDEKDFSKEMKQLHKECKSRYKEIKKNVSFARKEKIKFGFFMHFPNLFCKIHKLIHKL